MSHRRYVNTFIFSDAVPLVLLIEKRRPLHQLGRLNGIGGKIEPGESPEQAAVREIREECGLKFIEGELVRVGLFKGSDHTVYFFAIFARHSKFDRARTTTDEEVMTVHCSAIQTLPLERIMPNLRWQIPMAQMSRDACSEGYQHHFDITSHRR